MGMDMERVVYCQLCRRFRLCSLLSRLCNMGFMAEVGVWEFWKWEELLVNLSPSASGGGGGGGGGGGRKPFRSSSLLACLVLSFLRPFFLLSIPLILPIPILPNNNHRVIGKERRKIRNT